MRGREVGVRREISGVLGPPCPPPPISSLQVKFRGEDNWIVYIATESTLTMLYAMQGKFSREEGFFRGHICQRKWGSEIFGELSESNTFY